MIRALRIVYWALMPVFLFFGLYTGLRLYYVVLFAQVTLLAFALALNLWTAYSFSFIQTVSDLYPTRGDEVKLHLEINNDKPFPFSMMRLRVEHAPYSEPSQLAFSLPPNSRTSFDIGFTLPYRGAYQIGMSYLTVQDIFGLLPVRFDLRKMYYYRPLSLRVYPKLLSRELEDAGLLDAKFFQTAFSRPKALGQEYSELRRYVEGDSLRRVNWKVSAAHGELYTRQYDEPVEAGCLILLDDRTRRTGREALLFADLCCSWAATIAWRILSAGRQATLCDASGQTTIRGLGREDFSQLQSYLAAVPFGQRGDASESLRRHLASGAFSAAFVITEEPDEALREAALSASGVRLHVLCSAPGALASGGVEYTLLRPERGEELD